MQTELRVINLGKRGGKVVRHFFKETRPAYALTPITLHYAVQGGAITLMDVDYWLTSLGYSSDEVGTWLSIMANLYFRY